MGARNQSAQHDDAIISFHNLLSSIHFFRRKTFYKCVLTISRYTIYACDVIFQLLKSLLTIIRLIRNDIYHSLEEQHSDDCGSRGMGSIEESIEVRQEGVADFQSFFGDSSYLGPHPRILILKECGMH